MARLPDSKYKGIGSYLTIKVIQIAKQKGYKRIIHAFMIADNNSVKISEKHEIETFKRYTLYGQATL
jgi:L-amino acid N-acyltransferase YncA